MINLSPDGYFINYLVSDGTFHVIDNEVIRTSAIEKNYFLMQIKKETFPNLTEKQKDAIYRKLLEHYHCEDKMDFYKKHPVFWGVRWRNENETKEKNKALLEHYFGEASYLPQKTGFGDEGIPALLQRHA